MTDAVAGTPLAPVADDEYAIERHAVWKRFRRHRLALTGAVVLVCVVFIAVFAKFLPLQDPNFIDQVNWAGYPLAPGVAGHLLGTDENGRDLLARLVWGAQISLTVAFFAVLMEIVIGAFLGSLAGYYGGAVDYWIMRLTDVFLSIPLLPLLLVLTAIVADTSNKAALSFGVIVLIIGATSWPPAARLVRASFLSLREKEFAEAARAMGSRDARASSCGTCCPTRSRPSSCRRCWTSRASSSSSRRSRSWASGFSRRRRRGGTCSPTRSRTCRSRRGSPFSRACASLSPC